MAVIPAIIASSSKIINFQSSDHYCLIIQLIAICILPNYHLSKQNKASCKIALVDQLTEIWVEIEEGYLFD